MLSCEGRIINVGYVPAYPYGHTQVYRPMPSTQ